MVCLVVFHVSTVSKCLTNYHLVYHISTVSKGLTTYQTVWESMFQCSYGLHKSLVPYFFTTNKSPTISKPPSATYNKLHKKGMLQTQGHFCKEPPIYRMPQGSPLSPVSLLVFYVSVVNPVMMEVLFNWLQSWNGILCGFCLHSKKKSTLKNLFLFLVVLQLVTNGGL